MSKAQSAAGKTYDEATHQWLDTPPAPAPSPAPADVAPTSAKSTEE